MIISRTPFRISFFGGGTDYPAWYRKHGGVVLATTIDKYCYLTCRYLPPFFEHRIRIVYSKIETCQSVDEVQHPSVRAVLEYLKITRGIEIHHDGDLPARSGMGSSSSFTVGLCHALHALLGETPSKNQLARESIEIEQEQLHETVGSQDQILAAYGGFNHITFLDDGQFIVQPMNMSRDRIEELNSHLMLFYTGIKRTASDIAGGFVNDIEKKHRQLQSIRALADESVKNLANGTDISFFGEMLHDAWRIKRTLSSSVTNDNVDEVYAEARSAGALGGKLTGAGGGGFLLIFAPVSRRQNVLKRLHRLVHVPFKFEFSGSQIIFLDAEEDGSNIEQLRADRAP